MRIEGAFFDMDGLMLDTETINLKAWQMAAKEAGREMSWEDACLLLGRNQKDTIEYLKARWNMDVRPVNDRVEEIELELYRQGVDIKPGLMKLLNWLKAENIPAVTVTSSNRYIVELLLQNSGILPYMTELTCGNEITAGKPSPEIYLKAAAKLGIDPKHGVAFEDSTNGVLSAAAAGMAVFGVPDLVDLEARAEARLFKKVKDLDEALEYLKACKSEG
ncbi:HAD family hydrolase [Gehongia tenuis]|uniref:HAD family phosphatase n=1 Tax=Gehongia tenuis TaxID=2763655 RepID=A0A926HPK6_9FIRM|nr:HAD family phosphatase [Gehongia tenuis]MBC8531318.1 HAD family phosphatase [Gehongia tenuis]